MVRGREISARELLEAHLDRIDRLNPAVNAIVTLDADGARVAADAADAALAAGEDVGPLHGLPVAHKDTHATAGMRTTWGSPLHAGTVPLRDELVVARLKRAGAIRVGKTNVPEFAAGSHTFNPVFGVTHNPYRHGLSAGGSSGGAAAALAAGLVPLAEGSDMGGSLRNPAGFCNVVGLRPTPGRVPPGPAPIGWSRLSVQGPMGRTVADVALALSAIAGPDLRVPIALSEPGAGFAAPPPESLPGLRVAAAGAGGGRGGGPGRAGDGRPGDHIGARIRRPGVREARRDGRGGLPEPLGSRRGLRHAARLAVRGVVRRPSPAPPGQGQGVDPLERGDGRQAQRPRPRAGRDGAHEAVRADGRVLRALRRPAGADDAGAAVPRGARVPDRDRRGAAGQLPGVDALLHGHLGDRLPGAVGARRLHP